MSDKRELHVWIDADLYYALRRYALSYYSQYKNWLGRAVEDAIREFLERKGTIIHTQQTRHTRVKPSGRAGKVIECIKEQLGDAVAWKTADLLNAIYVCGGTDHRTVMKYLNLVQNHLGIRFHARNPCIFYTVEREGVPLQRIRFDSVRKLAILEKCIE